MNDKYTQYYFLGIGGIGMSAIARYFNAKGYSVAGYDRSETKLTTDLVAEGVEVNYDESEAMIPDKFRDPKKTQVIITPAIQPDHPQLEYFRSHQYNILKRSEILGQITRQSKAICIAGTHGKTTTSTMTAHLMYQSHVECSAFLGGISNNYHTNLLTSTQSNFVVVEADEYDRSFHHLTPYMAVITSLEADHLDIYGTYEAVIDSFQHFASLITPGGALIQNEKIQIVPKLKKGVKFFTYGMEKTSDFHANNIRIIRDSIYFDFVTPTEIIHDIRLTVPVMINVENGVAAMALGWLNGVTNEELRTAMSTFSGIYRRFNIVYNNGQVVYMDDYAHHPSELKASISSIRQLYPDRKITGIFQPHLYSRTRDFAAEFAESLSELDELILLDIYPARELPIEGVTSELILNDVSITDKTMTTKENLLILLDEKKLDVLVTFGAGDIDKMVPEIKKYLKKRYNNNTESK